MKKIGILFIACCFLMTCGKQNEPGGKETGGNQGGSSAYDEIVKAESWTADVTVSVVVNTSNTGENGESWSHSIQKITNYVGTLTPYPNGPYLSTTRYWKLTTAWVYAKINDETFETFAGVKTRSTLIGTKDFNVKDIIKTEIGYDSIILDFSSSSAYKIFIPEIQIDAYSTTYKPNEPGNIDYGPIKNQHSLPGANLAGIAYPSSASSVSGSKTVKQMIFGASGDGMMLDVNVTWEFKPEIPLGPLKK